MFFRRRTLTLLLALGLVGAPAALMRALCVGHSCDVPAAASSSAPFCRLPAELRRGLLAGYREGRSPDVFAVARTEGALEIDGTPWPGVRSHVERVPVVISAPVEASGDIRLDQIAPTVAALIGLDRPHPEVRSGEAIPLREALDEPPRVVLLVGIKGWGDLDRAPRALQSSIRSGLATEISSASVPADPAALFTTVGTGGLPRQHGITGSVLRNQDGASTRAWGPDAPTSVISTLADDLDELTDERATVAMVAHDATDRGLIGDGWYVDPDRDAFVVEPLPARAGRAFESIVRAGAQDAALYALSLDQAGGTRRVDVAIGRARQSLETATGGDVVTIAVGTGPRPDPAIDEAGLMAQLGEAGGLIERTVAGGFFVDQEELARTATTEDALVDALKEVDVEGRPLFADVFTGISLAFGRYC